MAFTGTVQAAHQAPQAGMATKIALNTAGCLISRPVDGHEMHALEDDPDGGPADETMRFGIGGSNCEST